jgi:hypothetical protein
MVETKNTFVFKQLGVHMRPRLPYPVFLLKKFTQHGFEVVFDGLLLISLLIASSVQAEELI